MHIGIMGGTFDPIHIAHLIAAEQALALTPLKEVWFLPAYQPPHKEGVPLTASEHRLNMTRLAIDGHARFRMCELEFERRGVSYTVDTALLLRERHPHLQFHWIIGSDMIAYLPKWHKIDELAKLIGFVGLRRPGYGEAERSLPRHVRDVLQMADMPQLDISSTDIRRRSAVGLPFRYMVAPPVYDYIKENRLYES